MVDVLLVEATEADLDEFRAHPPAGNPACQLGYGASIEELDDGLADLVMNACSLRGHFFVPPREFGCRYAFVLQQPLTEAFEWRWDSEPHGVLAAAMSLSRLVRHNFHNTKYIARVIEHDDGMRQVIPFDGRESRQAYGVHGDRDWLDAAEAAELRTLMAAYFEALDSLPERFAQALSRSEHLVQERYLNIMLPRLVATLEGLIGTSPVQVTKQFITRVPALAAEVGVEDVSKNLCNRLYQARSQGFHGSAIDLLRVPSQDATIRKVALLQGVLRAALRRGLEDPAFRAVFTDADSVDARWPVA